MSSETNSGGPSRRRLLAAALAAAGGVAFAGGGWLVARSRREGWSGARGWIDESVLDSATRLGEEHLAAAPEFDPEAAWRALDERLAPWPDAGLGDATFRERVRRAIESDFAREATVEIRSYRFAVTEAQLCALVALAARQSGE